MHVNVKGNVKIYVHVGTRVTAIRSPKEVLEGIYNDMEDTEVPATSNTSRDYQNTNIGRALALNGAREKANDAEVRPNPQHSTKKTPLHSHDQVPSLVIVPLFLP